MVKVVALIAVGASALTSSRSSLPRAPARATASAGVTMEDFGLMKGTKFDFAKEWSEREGGTRFEDVLSEARMETYMNDKGLRFKMNKTAKEREVTPKLFGGLLPEIQFTIPGLNVDVNIAAPRVDSIWEALGFTATSNNLARVEEKAKAVEKEKANKQKYDGILSYWKDKYGNEKYYPGSWFYADQLSTDPVEVEQVPGSCERGAINTPIRAQSGFRMRKGGFYLDGTKDTRK